jgi:HPt (histidine-containing phosphotransfer) domain-containing protein
MRPPARTAQIDEEMFAQISSLRGAGGYRLVHELVAVFLRDTDDRLRALRAAADAGDGRAIGKVAHALKGSAGILGARGLAGFCVDLEKGAASPGFTGVEEALRDLEEEFARVRGWLARALGA